MNQMAEVGLCKALLVVLIMLFSSLPLLARDSVVWATQDNLTDFDQALSAQKNAPTKKNTYQDSNPSTAGEKLLKESKKLRSGKKVAVDLQDSP